MGIFTLEKREKPETTEEVISRQTDIVQELTKVNTEIFGLNSEQAVAASVVMDRMITSMSQRAGVSPEQMYSLITFVKGDVMPENDNLDAIDGREDVSTIVDVKKSTEIIKEVKSTEPVNKIEDVGEKIGGAKKDIYQRLDNITDSDIENLPLSKIFPEPEYQKLIDDGVLKEDAAYLLKYLYQNIPAKPRKKYRIKGWVDSVKSNIETFKAIISDDGSDVVSKIYAKMKDSQHLGFFKDMDLNIEMYKRLGLDLNMGRFGLKKFDFKGDGVYSIVDGNFILKDFNTLDDLAAGLYTLLSR